MKIIGITGQTGAGKSTVCEILKNEGFYHIDADEVAHCVVESDSDVLEALSEAFGSDIIKKDGTLSRPRLARKAFRSKESAEKLDAICYPAVIKKIRQIIDEKSKESYKGILVDAIGLFESGADKLCDFTVSVTAPKEARLKRIIGRDGISEDAALRRIEAQKDESYYTENADYTVYNDNLSDLNSRILEILKNEQD